MALKLNNYVIVLVIFMNFTYMHFTELSGHHSVLERPLSEVNGRLFFS